MALDVSRALKNPGQVFPFKAAVALPRVVALGDPVTFEETRVQGEFFCTGDHRISLKAEADARVASRCCRCLDPVQTSVHASVDAMYAKVPDPEDPDLYDFEGDALDLARAVGDALVLELPMQFFCAPNCRGLCPVCGANLNRQTCTCQEGNVVTGPFSALKEFVRNNEEV